MLPLGRPSLLGTSGVMALLICEGEEHRSHFGGASLRVLECIESAAKDMPSARMNDHAPFAALGIERNISKMLAPLPSEVLTVLRPSRKTQILPSVIETVTIPVVDLDAGWRIQKKAVKVEAILDASGIEAVADPVCEPSVSTNGLRVTGIDSSPRALASPDSTKDQPYRRAVGVRFDIIRPGPSDGSKWNASFSLPPVRITETVAVGRNATALWEHTLSHSFRIVS